MWTRNYINCYCNMEMIIEFALPIATRSEMNLREHWTKRHKRLKEHKHVSYLLTEESKYLNGFYAIEGNNYKLHLCRHGRKMLDADNLPSSFKGIIDGICLALGIDDGKVAMVFEQTEKNKVPFVTVKIEVI